MPIKMLGTSILHDAAIQKASDIHLIPIKKGGIVQYRIDDRLIEYKNLSQEEYIRVIAHFKYSARMDIGEQRKPQSGAMDIMIDNVSVHLRLSTIPSAFNECNSFTSSARNIISSRIIAFSSRPSKAHLPN